MSLDTWFLMLILKTYCFFGMNYNKNKCEKKNISPVKLKRSVKLKKIVCFCKDFLVKVIDVI